MKTIIGTYSAWVDARHAASEARQIFAWVEGNPEAGWTVSSSDSVKDAPNEPAAEFIEGVQQ